MPAPVARPAPHPPRLVVDGVEVLSGPFAGRPQCPARLVVLAAVVVIDTTGEVVAIRRDSARTNRTEAA
jgi:hypothetical protein